MAAPINQALLKDISDRRIAYTDAAIRGFDSGLESVSASLRQTIIELLSSLDYAAVVPAKRLVDLSRQLQAQMNRSDYDGLVTRFLSKYDGVLQFAYDTLTALRIKAPRLAPLDGQALNRLRAMDYDFLVNVGTDTVQAVANGLVQQTLMGTPRAAIIQQISSTLETNFQHRAVTYADTALVSYDRRAAANIWTGAGIKQYLYRGPKDIKNRPFCAHHVGQVYTLDQINGQLNAELADYSHKPLLPCLVYGGGYNCRHVWTPVPPA